LPSITSEREAAPVPMWTGFYAGLSAGGTWTNSSSTSVNTSSVFINYPNLSNTGITYSPAAAWLTSQQIGSGYADFIGGGQVGYNLQVYQKIIIGMETDIQGIAGSGKQSQAYQIVPRAAPDSYVFGLVSTSRNLSYLGTLRGKVGYLIFPNLFVYGTGGFAYGGVSSSIFMTGAALPYTGASPFFSYGSTSLSRTGWAAGGGAEWMFVRDWSVKVEYLYYDLANLSYNPSPSISYKSSGPVNFMNLSSAHTHFSGNIVRLGVNYHFDFGKSAPVVAKF